MRDHSSTASTRHHTEFRGVLVRPKYISLREVGIARPRGYFIVTSFRYCIMISQLALRIRWGLQAMLLVHH